MVNVPGASAHTHTICSGSDRTYIVEGGVEGGDTLSEIGYHYDISWLTLAYHNHTEEFETVEGEVPYHMFLKQLTPDIKMELDLCWAVKAGVDPIELFQQHPGRFALWHVKDLDKEKNLPVPVGEGIIDFKRIFEHASEAGMKHFFVEHDMPAHAFASITSSFNYLNNKLKV